MNRTMNGPIGTRSALRMSGTKTENRVAAWASNRHFRASSQSRFAYQSWSLGSMVSRSRGRVPRSDSILAVHRRTTPPIVWVDQPGFRLLPASAPARTRATSRRVVQRTLAVLWSVPDRSVRSGSATQSPVGTGRVVVLEPLLQNALEMATVQDQNPVQALAPSRTNLPLHVGIGLGCCNRRPGHFDTCRLKDNVGAAAVLGVVIVDQEASVDSNLA